MLKFEYNYLEKTLSVQHGGESYQLITKTFTTNGGSPGFILEPKNHGITFTIYPNKITAFYKEVQEDADPESWPTNLKGQDGGVSADTLAPLTQKITYYQKDLPKTNPLAFTFQKSDQVQKIDGQGIKKHDKN